MSKTYRWLFVGFLILGLLLFSLRPLSEFGLRSYLKYHTAQVAPLSAALSREHFSADTTGDKSHYKRAEQLEIQINDYYRNTNLSHIFRFLLWSGIIKDSLLQRELELIYLDFLGSQGDKEKLDALIAQQTKIEERFTVFRPQWQGQDVSNQFLKSILVNSTNEDDLAAAWKAGCQVGAAVGPQLLELVKMRNEIASSLGYQDYFQMRLKLAELNEKELDQLFHRVDELTAHDYQKYKQDMDKIIARRYARSADELRPWHYQQIFLQQPPDCCAVQLDAYYKQNDITEVITSYFNDLGFPADKILAASDLKPRPMKYPYAYCIDINRTGDVRILANLKNDSDSAQTLLHEMGHAVYDTQINPKLPWRLRAPASIATTEAIAMMFGDMAYDPEWLVNRLGVSSKSVNQLADQCLHTQRLNNLIFCRWSLVMYYFEKQLYSHPESDLDKYWWELVQRYQLITPPSDVPPYGWAAKVHLATAPVYYYNYTLGRIMAFQIAEGWHQELIAPGQQGHALAEYLKDAVFCPGASLTWQDLLLCATGHPLNPDIINRESSSKYIN